MMAGRPKLPDDERRDLWLKIRVSRHELDLIESAASDEQTTTWARNQLLVIAQESVETA